MDRIDKEKIKEFFQNKRNLKIMIGVITALVVVLVIWFFWTIYTQDKPQFIPKETRGDIREGIKEGIAKPIEKVIPSIGKQIVDAAHQPKETNQTETNNTNNTNDTSTWQMYKNETYGYEVKYPEDYLVKENIQPVDDYLGSMSFWKKEDYQKNQNGVFPEFEVAIFGALGSQSAIDWVKIKDNPQGTITNITTTRFGSNEWLTAEEAGDPDHKIFVLKSGAKVYKISTMLDESGYMGNVLNEFATN